MSGSFVRAHGIMFHHLHGGIHPRVQGSISPDELAAQLEFLGPERILAPEEWAERAGRGQLEPRHLCLTFDDTLRCQYDLARPVLESYGLRGFWFVYTSVLTGELERLELYRWFRTVHYDSVEAFYAAFEEALSDSGEPLRAKLADFEPRKYLAEFSFYTDADRRFRFIRDEWLGPARYVEVMEAMLESAQVDLDAVARTLWMDAEQLRALRDAGHVVGLHSHTHPTRLARLSIERQRDEYERNAEVLGSILGQEPWSMSHPCNSYGRETLTLLEALGIRMGFRANLEPHEGALELPREDHARILARMREDRA